MSRYAVEIVAVQTRRAGGQTGDVAKCQELLLAELHVVVVATHVIAAVAQEVKVIAEFLGFQELDFTLVDFEWGVDALAFAVEEDYGVCRVGGSRGVGGCCGAMGGS